MAIADDRKPMLLLGLGLLGVAGYELLKKPAAAPATTTTPITCPAGYHVEGNVCVQDPPPPTAVDTRPIVTAQPSLTVRSGPGTGYAAISQLGYGTHVTIECQTWGSRVVRSAVWDKISAPVPGYVSDWYLSTPNVGSFSPGYAVCAGTGSPPSGSGSGSGSGTVVTPPKAGKPPLTSLNQLVARMIISTGCGGCDADYIVLARRATATASPRFGRVWIRDQFTWDGLGVSRSAVWRVSPALLYAIADAGTLRRQIVIPHAGTSGGGIFWIWDAHDGPVWDTAMAYSPFGSNRGPFAVLKGAAGYC